MSVIKHLFYIVLALTTVYTVSNAEVVKIKGKGEITYNGLLGQSPADTRLAILEAKKNAITRYAATFDSARFELYKRIENIVLSKIDNFISDYIVLNEQTNKDSKTYVVIIEATINPSQIETLIQSTSGPAGPSPTVSNNTSFLSFVFVARELASKKIYEDKHTSVQVTSESKTGSDKNTISGNSSEQSESLAQEKSSISENITGGNTEIKADVLSYRVSTATDIDNAVNSILTKARYETVDPVDAGIDIELFKRDFSTGNDISSTTRRTAIKALKEKDIRYLAIANMDVGLPDKDPVSGMVRVYVTVTAKVTDLSPKFPKTVASLAGKPYAGLGPNTQVAKQNALNEAAANSATELVDQLRMKNVQ